MKTIKGYDVKIFTDNVEESAIEQIKELMSIDVFADKKIRVMPDVHAGAGFVMRRIAKKAEPSLPEGLCYVEGEARGHYLHDMRLWRINSCGIKI